MKNKKKYKYIPKREPVISREDQEILKGIFESTYDANQIRVIELLQEMHNTSDQISKQVLELKQSALIMNAPDSLKGKVGFGKRYTTED